MRAIVTCYSGVFSSYVPIWQDEISQILPWGKGNINKSRVAVRWSHHQHLEMSL